VELLHRVVGPIGTNVYVLGDEASREAIAIDTATPCVSWLTERLAERGWTLKLIVSSHWHWDHVGDNAAVQEATGAKLAAHALDRHLIEHPLALSAPFPIPPSVPAVELAEGGAIRFGSISLEVLHTPGHTAGSICLLAREEGIVFTGDTLFASGFGRVDLPGASAEAMVESLTRLSRLEGHLRVRPGHGAASTIERERPWLELVAASGQLLS
jgi:glyoxylase-like metal-dependent hydrolase (beta-lactamase superfamily II)